MEVDELQYMPFVTKTVGGLPPWRGFLGRMGFAHIIGTCCPLAAQVDLSCGIVTEILIANRLQAPKPLYQAEKWAREAGVEGVLGGAPGFGAAGCRAIRSAKNGASRRLA